MIRLWASATRLRIPPESWCGCRSSKPDSPTRRSQSRARAIASFLGTPRNSGPAATLPSTDFHGNTASFWNMKPIPSPIPRTGAPLTSTSPSLTRSSPEISDRVVDLPQPVGPTIAQNSPGATDSFRSRSAVYAAPVGVRNRLVAERSSIAGVLMATT